MSNLVIVRNSLEVRSAIPYSGQPAGFNGVQLISGGPSPGQITVPIGGVAVSLSELITPGYYRIANQDTTNFVEIGIRDVSNNRFYPIHEILPGETYVNRFSRNLLEDYYNTGTGTSAEVNQLWLKANRAPVKVVLEAFEA